VKTMPFEYLLILPEKYPVVIEENKKR